MSNRRMHERRKVALVIKASGHRSKAGRTKDLSPTGAFVEGWQLALGTELEVVFPEAPEVGCLARVVRVEQSGVAVLFVGPSVGFQEIVEKKLDGRG